MKRYLVACMIGLTLAACSKSDSGSQPTTGNPPPQQGINFTSNNATSAYNDFNKYLFDPVRKLYYRASDKSGIGAIWTQAIYWDMAMNAFKRTNDAKYKTQIDDIFEGCGMQYANYDWKNDSK